MATRAVSVSNIAWKIETKRPEKPAADDVPVRVDEPPEKAAMVAPLDER